ncbi:MAG: hypothetical protein K2H98_08635, partial [Duncaniella sp.]|nr:hypothetical protein [Duncaniella sp.]
VYADMGRGSELQPYKHGGKELDLMHGLCHYDYLARAYDPILCVFTRPDSRALDFSHISPRSFCANNPVNFVDPDGNAVYLYTTYLPGRLGSIFKKATHSFIYISNPKTKVSEYFAYGPESDLAMFGTSRLQRNFYVDDINAYSDEESRVKEKFLIPVPEGMTEEEFDKEVGDVAKSFAKNPNIMYHIWPTGIDQGNCNSSTYTILKKAGVSQEVLDEIGSKIKGLSTGFGMEKPWTDGEQKIAVENARKLREIFMTIPSDKIYFHSF